MDIGAGHLNDELLIIGIRRFFNGNARIVVLLEDVTHSIKHLFLTCFSKLTLKLVLYLNQDIVANSKLSFDLIWRIKANDFAMRHDANAISQFVGLFDMLRAHNN